jgi:hypothetical protein
MSGYCSAKMFPYDEHTRAHTHTNNLSLSIFCSTLLTCFAHKKISCQRSTFFTHLICFFRTRILNSFLKFPSLPSPAFSIEMALSVGWSDTGENVFRVSCTQNCCKLHRFSICMQLSQFSYFNTFIIVASRLVSHGLHNLKEIYVVVTFFSAS